MKTNIKNSGGTLEGTVKSILTSKGFELLSYREWDKDRKKHSNELLLMNVPFTTIYKHSGKTEFLLISEKYKLEIRIECKWQQVAGSVDEKLPYLYLNCIEAMPEEHIIIIIDGDGWKPGAKTWLEKAVSEKKYQKHVILSKNIVIFSLREFITWANKKFI